MIVINKKSIIVACIAIILCCAMFLSSEPNIKSLSKKGNVSALVEIVKSNKYDSSVRTEALEALDQLSCNGNLESINALIDIAVNCDDETTRRTAGMQLGSVRDKASVPLLILALATGQQTSNYYLVDSAAKALAYIGETSAVPHLVNIISNGYNSYEVMLSLCRLASPDNLLVSSMLKKYLYTSKDIYKNKFTFYKHEGSWYFKINKDLLYLKFITEAEFKKIIYEIINTDLDSKSRALELYEDHGIFHKYAHQWVDNHGYDVVRSGAVRQPYSGFICFKCDEITRRIREGKTWLDSTEFNYE